MNYFIWHSISFNGNFCMLGILEGVPDDDEISMGISRADGFPEKAYYEMRTDVAEKHVKICDNIYSVSHCVVSEKLKKVLEPELGESRVEFLPVKIKDRKGKFVKGDYFIMNPLDVIDVIDVEASGGQYNLLAPDKLMYVDNGIKFKKSFQHNPVIFRPEKWARLIIIREDILEKLEAANLTGISFWNLEEFSGIGA